MSRFLFISIFTLNCFVSQLIAAEQLDIDCEDINNQKKAECQEKTGLTSLENDEMSETAIDDAIKSADDEFDSNLASSDDEATEELVDNELDLFLLELIQSEVQDNNLPEIKVVDDNKINISKSYQYSQTERNYMGPTYSVKTNSIKIFNK